MTLGRRSIAMVVAFMALAGAGLALADGNGNTPRIDPVQATFRPTGLTQVERTCQGEDGLYAEVKAVVRGNTTGDPRLSGPTVARFRDFFNTDTGDGVLRGDLVVTEAGGGQKKVKGNAISVDYRLPAGDESAGFIRGKVKEGETSDLPGGALFANFRVSFINGTVQIGGSWRNSRIPAVIQRGHCTGPFHTPSPAAGGAGSAPAGAVGRWAGLAK